MGTDASRPDMGPLIEQGINVFGGMGSVSFLTPLLMIGSLALLFYSRASSPKQKGFATIWQIVIGIAGCLIALQRFYLMNMVTQSVGIATAYMNGGGFSVAPGIGLYLFAAGSLAVVVGGFKMRFALLQVPSQP